MSKCMFILPLALSLGGAMATQTATATFSMPSSTKSATLPSASETKGITTTGSTSLTESATNTVELPTATTTQSDTPTVTLTDSATLIRTVTLPTGTSTATTTLPTQGFTASETRTITLPSQSLTASPTDSLPTATGTRSPSWDIPTSSRSTSETVTMPDATATGTTLTLPTLSPSLTISLPAATRTVTRTVTLPESSATFTLPSGSVTYTPPVTPTLPTSTVTTTYTLSRTASLPSASPTTGVTESLPTNTASLTHSMSLLTLTGTQSPTMTMPTASGSESTSLTVSMPTRSPTRELTATMPTITGTISLTTSFPSVTVSKTSTLTMTLPSPTQSPSLTASMPTLTSSDTATYTFPTDTNTETRTITLPEATDTLTLPTGTASATTSLTLPSKSGSLSASVSLPTRTRTVTETLSTTVTLPSSTQTSTRTISVTLPSHSLTLTLTRTLPTVTLSQTLTQTLPTITRTITVSLSLPSDSATMTKERTLTLPTETVSETLSQSLPTLTPSPSASLTLPSSSGTRSSSASETSSLSDTFSVPTETETNQPYAPRVVCERVGGTLRTLRDSTGQPLVLASNAGEPVDNEVNADMVTTSGNVGGDLGSSQPKAIWAYIGDNVECTVTPGEFSLVNATAAVEYEITIGTTDETSTTYRVRNFDGSTRGWRVYTANGTGDSRLPDLAFRLNESTPWVTSGAGEPLLTHNEGNSLSATNKACVDRECEGNATKCTLEKCQLVENRFQVGYPCHAGLSQLYAPDRVWATYAIQVTALSVTKQIGRDVVEGDWNDANRAFSINKFLSEGVFKRNLTVFVGKAQVPSEPVRLLETESSNPFYPAYQFVARWEDGLDFGDGFVVESLLIRHRTEQEPKILELKYVTKPALGSSRHLNRRAFAEPQVLATVEVVYDVHYMYGTASSLQVTCPESGVHARSITTANECTEGPCAEALRGADNAHKGDMVYCYVQGFDSWNNTVLPDPLRGQTQITSATEGITEEYSVSDPTSDVCTPAGLSSCNPPVLKAGRPAYTEVLDEQVILRAPTIQTVQNTMVPHGARTRYAYEPLGYGRAVINFALARGSNAQRRIVDVGGMVQPSPLWLLECSTNVLDPMVPDSYAECFVTAPGASSDMQPTFASSFIVSDVDGAAPSESLAHFFTFSEIRKTGAAANFAAWSGLTDPGFTFSFKIYPTAQGRTFDGVKKTLFLTYMNRFDLPAGMALNQSYAESFQEGVACAGEIPAVEYIVLRSFDMESIITPDPTLEFTCNGKPCGGARDGVNLTIGAFPDLISPQSSTLSEPLVINPYLRGAGTPTVTFQRLGQEWCWQSENYQTLTEIYTLNHCLPGTLQDAFDTPDTGSLVVKQLPVVRPADGVYTFLITFGGNVKGKVVVFYNEFSVAGTVTIPTPTVTNAHLPALVYCQNFYDVNSPFTVWIEGVQVPTDSVDAVKAGTMPASLGAEFAPLTEAWQDFRFGQVASTGYPRADTQWEVPDGIQLSEVFFRYIPLGSGSAAGQEPVNVSKVGISVTQPVTARSPTANAPPNIADGRVTSDWLDYASESIVVKFPQVTRVDEYTLATGNGPIKRDPVQWRLEGSSNGQRWVLLHLQNNNFPVTRQRGTNVNGSHNPVWFPISPWEPIYYDTHCKGCLLLGAETQVSSLTDCQRLCQRTCADSACTYAGCSHINYNVTSKHCQRLDCTGATVTNGTSGSTQCWRLAAGFLYFRLTPLRLRETPFLVYFSNPSPSVENVWALRCVAEDSKGSVARSNNFVTLTVKPQHYPVEREATDQYTELLREMLRVADSPIDMLVVTGEILTILEEVSGQALIQTARLLASGVVDRLGSVRGAMHPITIKRLTDVLWLLLRVVFTRISPQDPTVTDAERLDIGRAVADVLKEVTLPKLAQEPTAWTLANVAKSVSAILGNLQRISSITPPIAAQRKAAAEQTLQTQEGSGGSVVNLVARETADDVIDIGCQLGVHAFQTSGASAFLGGCTQCTQCAENGMPLSVCVDTAWAIRGQEVKVGDSSVRVVKEADSTDLADVQSKLLYTERGERVDLQWPVALVSYRLPAATRAYDNDYTLLRGEASYFCLYNLSHERLHRVQIPVTSAEVQISVALEPVDSDKVPIGIARRVGGAWVVDDCDDGSKTLTASPSESGSVVQVCNALTTEEHPGEFAAVARGAAKRCTPGDFLGCVEVVDAQKSFDDCQCALCTSVPRSDIERAAAPRGFFVRPIAFGKTCVPFANYSCLDTDRWVQGVRGDYTVLHKDQCTGGSVVSGHKCVCDVGKVCAGGLCEATLFCNDTGATSQCEASGLQQQGGLTCACNSDSYCRNVTALERSKSIMSNSQQLAMVLGTQNTSWEQSVDQWSATFLSNILATPDTRSCLPLVGCSTDREVLSPLACANGSVYERRFKRCVCPSTHYCDADRYGCFPKARCGEEPAEKSSTYCWPVDGGQPQLLLSSNSTTNKSTCVCPYSLQCEAETKACSCPVCKNGGECLWPKLRWQQDLHPHTCTCGEGYMGADCGEQEPKASQFVDIHYPQASFAGFNGLSTASKAKAEGAVRSGVQKEIAAALSSTGGANKSRPLASASDVGLQSVYFRQGSIIVNVEILVWQSTWTNRVSQSLTQAQLGVTVSQELAAQLAAGDLSSLGNLTAPAVGGVAAACPVIPNCAFAPLPWDACRCSLCIAGWVPHPGWTLPTDPVNNTIRGMSCVADTLCTNADDCNGRGAADGIRALGCLCSCAPDYQGNACERDMCLINMHSWQQPGCGAFRCSQRNDGFTLPDYEGDVPGLCKEPSSSGLGVEEDILIVFITLTVAVCIFACVFYGLHHRCPWEPTASKVVVSDEGSDLDEAEEELGQRQEDGGSTEDGHSESEDDDAEEEDTFGGREATGTEALFRKGSGRDGFFKGRSASRDPPTTGGFFGGRRPSKASVASGGGGFFGGRRPSKASVASGGGG
eukprot:Hpha_TRINITY_DN16294_c2_g5::TRINITY_DN16294_c2_g5_i2::g.12363::m.12363